MRWRRQPSSETDLVRAALHNRTLRRVVVGFAGLTMGEWVLGTTVAIYAYSAGGALAVGLVGFRFAPAAVAGLWTTQLADHPQRQRVLALTAMTRGAAAAASVVAVAVDAPTAAVVGLVWLDAAAGSTYRPAQAALLPTLARTPGELTAATTLTSNVKSSGQFIGALLGGALVAVLPFSAAIAGAALLYGAAAAVLAPGFSTRAASAPTARIRVGLSGLRAGASLLRADREARVTATYACLRSLVRGLWVALAVVASLKLLSLGSSGLGILMAAAGLGAVAAIFVSAQLVGNPRLADWFAAGLLLCGLPVAATGLVGSPAPAIVFMVLWGLGMALADVGAQTLLTRLVPAASIGRVTGAMESGKLLFEGAGSLMAPALLVLGTRGALLVAGGVLPVLVVLGHGGFGRIDDRALGRVDVLELLQGVPFFGLLHVDALEGVAARLRSEQHPAGTEIVRQGELDSARWYLVAEGELVVEVDGFLVGELRRGGQFGERGLLRGVPRSATVRARTDVALFALEREDFLAALAGPDLDETPSFEVERAERIDPAAALTRSALLGSMPSSTIARLGALSHVREVAPGTPIIVDGETDDTYHVLLSGRAEVFVDGALRRELLPGDAFGEIAVLHRVPRTASVVASDPSSILTLEGEDVRAAVRDHGGAVAALAS